MDRVDAIDHAALEGLVDLDRLNEWMTGQDLPGDGPVTGALRLQGGSQNNIFLLQRGDAQMVLRRPPLHLRKNSNDTMLREARVLGAIAGSGVPHPELFGSCDDLDVIGVCFYLMAPIDGFTPPGEPAYADDPEWPRHLAEEMAEGAARLGAIDHEAVGLADFGKSENWLERQVGRWRSQLEGYSELEGYSGSELPARRPRRPVARGSPARARPDRDHPRRLPVRQRDVLARGAQAGGDRRLGAQHPR